MTDERRDTALRIGLSTFAILALELALIRWMSQQVRMFAYLNNFLLMCSFLGMGLGLGVGRRRPELIHAALPLLLILSAILGFSEELGLMRLQLPDPMIYTWDKTTNVTFGASIIKLLLLTLLVISIFVCAASLLGYLFGKYGDALGAYSWDLIGSLAGIIVMTILAAMNTTPPVWLAVAAIPLVVLSPRWTSWVAFAGVLAFATMSIRDARFSPYNRLDLVRDQDRPLKPLVLQANRDTHQFLLDFSPQFVTTHRLNESDLAYFSTLEFMYRLPFSMVPGKEAALVVGAGTGNDVAAALRAGFKRVVAVEIDPVIYDTGKLLHPERPYNDGRVEVVISDARTFFERNKDEKFDVVCFGLLDSHAMFSAMSSLRLDNYVYTREAIRAAYSHLRPGGVLSVAFSVAGGEWIAERIYRLLRESTGGNPLTVDFTAPFGTRTWMVGKDRDLSALASRIPYAARPTPLVSDPKITTDDWPFLYLKPRTFPYGLMTMLVLLLIIAAAGARVVYGESFFSWRRFSGSFFFLGAAFLLVETRGVTNLSLLFGSTWIVNSAVFAGILSAALAANFIARRVKFGSLTIPFVLLAIALMVNYAVPPGAFLRFSPGVGGVLAALVNGIPVGLAGLIFSNLLSRSHDPAGALGWNLLGAVLGGCLEYSSMAFGLRTLILIALALYALAALSLSGSRSLDLTPQTSRSSDTP